MTNAQFDAAFAVARHTIDATGYGAFVPDAKLERLVWEILTAAEKAAPKHEPPKEEPKPA